MVVSSVLGSFRKPSHLKWNSYRISVWILENVYVVKHSLARRLWRQTDLISVQWCPSFLLRCKLWSDRSPSTGLFQCSRENGKHVVPFSNNHLFNDFLVLFCRMCMFCFWKTILYSLKMLPAKNLFYFRFGAKNLFFVSNSVYESGIELQEWFWSCVFIPQNVNC